MRVTMPFPAAWLKGRYTADLPTFYVRGGKTFGRARTTPKNPRTDGQQQVRAWWKEARGTWRRLGYARSVAWEKFAGEMPRQPRRWSAYFECSNVMFWRCALGTNASLDPPAPVRTPKATAIHQETVGAADEFAFRVDHSIDDFERYRLVAEITPAMPSVRRKPRTSEYVWIKGVGPESIVPLQASGSVYRFPGGRHPVADGQRYGIRVRIVRDDGLPGDQTAADFIRKVDAEESRIAADRAAAELLAADQYVRERRYRNRCNHNGDHWPIHFSLGSFRHVRYEDRLSEKALQTYLNLKGWKHQPDLAAQRK